MSWVEIVPGLWKAPYTTKNGIECNAITVKLADGGLCVISPPTNHEPRLFDELDAIGPVRALVAPNTGHDAGQAAWQARYPDASVHAPAPTAKAVSKSQPKLRAFEPMAALVSRLAPGTTIVDVPGASSGCMTIGVSAGAERALVLDDCFGNATHNSGPAVFRFLFWATGSGPGLVRNKIWWFAFAKDKPAVARTILAEWDRLAPTKLAFFHGDEATAERIGEARAQLAVMAP